jgi:hypothetical protein
MIFFIPKPWAFFCILCAALLIPPLSAQEEGEEAEEPDVDTEYPIPVDWNPFRYTPGDQAFIPALGVTVPTLFLGESGALSHNISVGVTLSLSYIHFLTPNLFVGGEINGMAATTKRANLLYIVPFGAKVGWQFTLTQLPLPFWMRRFEIPVSLTIGGAAQSYLDNEENYFGFFLKPEVSLFFRFNQDWSFGLNVDWWWIPQWTREPSKDVYGNFLGITIAARYHF